MATRIGRRCKFSKWLPYYHFPTLSSLFLPLLVLSGGVLWWMGGREDKGTHGRSDIRIDGRTDENKFYRMFIVYRRKKGADTHTDRQKTSYSITVLDDKFLYNEKIITNYLHSIIYLTLPHLTKTNSSLSLSKYKRTFSCCQVQQHMEKYHHF